MVSNLSKSLLLKLRKTQVHKKENEPIFLVNYFPNKMWKYSILKDLKYIFGSKSNKVVDLFVSQYLYRRNITHKSLHRKYAHYSYYVTYPSRMNAPMRVKSFAQVVHISRHCCSIDPCECLFSCLGGFWMSGSVIFELYKRFYTWFAVNRLCTHNCRRKQS